MVRRSTWVTPSLIRHGPMSPTTITPAERSTERTVPEYLLSWPSLQVGIAHATTATATRIATRLVAFTLAPSGSIIEQGVCHRLVRGNRLNRYTARFIR